MAVLIAWAVPSTGCHRYVQEGLDNITLHVNNECVANNMELGSVIVQG